jgi:hypothetical protein
VCFGQQARRFGSTAVAIAKRRPGCEKKRLRRRFVKPAPRDRGGSVSAERKWLAVSMVEEGSYLAELGGARGGGHREGGGGGDGGSLVDCDARGVGIRVSVVARS